MEKKGRNVVPSNRRNISLYEEAKAGLISLIQQTTLVSVGFLVMLLLTGGNPPAFVVGLSVCFGIAFAAWSEKKRLTDSRALYIPESDHNQGVTKSQRSDNSTNYFKFDRQISIDIATEPQLTNNEVTQKEQNQELIKQNQKDYNYQKADNNAAKSRKIYKIISVDDSPTFLKEIRRFLGDENFSVITISDPFKAVMSIIRNKPDLILLDANMEGIDGYELCRIIRNNSLFKKTPIIMVTGNKGIVDKVKARLVGASGYLTKPFSRADLLKIVFMHLT